MTTPALLDVGYIRRAHGVRGEVTVQLTSDRVERLAPGTVLDTERGPLTVVGSRPHQGNHLVRFAEITDRTQAERWMNVALRAEPLADPEALWVHELVGSRVVEQRSGAERGEVVAVLANPAHDLLELDSGALVPVVFVVSCADGVTTIDPPDGLFDVA